MASTYDPAHPTDKDRVRAALGDTAVTPGTTTIPDDDALHTDEHINAMITAYGYPLGLSELAHELWARFAQDPNSISVTGLSVSFSNLLAAWSELAKPWVAHLEIQARQAAAALRAPANATPPSAFGLASGKRGG